MQDNFVIYNEEYTQIKSILSELKKFTQAKHVFITDSEGHCIASTGEIDEVYLNSISSLIAGSIAAVNGIGQMLNNSKSFDSVISESLEQSIYILFINERTMLVVVYSNESNLGIVKMRSKSALTKLKKVFTTINEKLKDSVSPEDAPFAGVTDEDIDKIFGD